MSAVQCSKAFLWAIADRRERPRSWLLTLKRRFVHAGHAWAVVLAREALDVHLQRHRADRGAEVEQTHLGGNICSGFNLEVAHRLLSWACAARLAYLINVQPVSKVPGVG